MNAGFMGIFPLTFLSNVFVEPETLPAGLEAFVDVNPISILADRLARADGGQRGRPATSRSCSATAAALTAVFAPLTTRLYRTKS